MLLSRSFVTSVRRGITRPSIAASLSTKAGAFSDTVFFDIEDPMIDIRWSSARCGVLGGEVLLRNLASDDLASRSKMAGPMKQVAETSAFSVMPSSSAHPLDLDTYEDMATDTKETISANGHELLFMLDMGVGAMAGLGTRAVTEDPRMAKMLQSLMLKYPARAPLDYKYAVTIVATAELDPQSPDMAYTASSQKEVTIRGPVSLAQMADAIAGSAGAVSVEDGKVVLSASAVLAGDALTLEMGSASGSGKGIQANGHVLWGEKGVTPMWGCSILTGEPLKLKQNMFNNIKAIKLPAGVAKVEGADEVAKAVAAFCPSGGSEQETEIVAKLIAESGAVVHFQ